MTSPMLISIQVAQVQTYGNEDAPAEHDRCWTTAFFKRPIVGSIAVSHLGLVGDDQADKRFHGGPDKAVLAYSADHFTSWQQELPQIDCAGGAFGENLTIVGLDEQSAHLGDVYSIGTVRLEVSQPRRPCWKLSRRWRIDDLTQRVTNNGRSGWYLRVLQPGEIAPGQPVQLLSRPHPDWPIARAQQLMYFGKQDLRAAAEIIQVPALAASWREAFLERLKK